MRFTPALIEVREGETLRLVHRNRGQQLHEFVLGTREELEFACLIPGHYQAGMVGKIKVTPR